VRYQQPLAARFLKYVRLKGGRVYRRARLRFSDRECHCHRPCHIAFDHDMRAFECGGLQF